MRLRFFAASCFVASVFGFLVQAAWMAEPAVNTWDRARALRRSGRLRAMSELEVKVYLVLLEHSNSQTGLVRLSAERLAHGEPEWPLGGVCSNVTRVRKALAALVGRGAIEVAEQGGGSGRVSQYRVLLAQLMPLFDPVVVPRGVGNGGGAVASAERGTVAVPDSAGAGEVAGVVGVVGAGIKGDAGRLKGGRLAREKGDGGRPERGTAGVPRVSSLPQKPPPPPAEAAETRGTVRVPVCAEGGAAGGGKVEEEEGEEIEIKRGLRKGTAGKMVRLIARGERDRIWSEVVNDKAVKRRPAVYFYRLREFLEGQELKT